ncbi:MAG: CNNM domain-containing protein [Candidatus Krumholzibacteriia bacterium]
MSGVAVLGWEATAAAGIIFLFLSAFFSGAETGYMSVSRVRLRRLEEADPRARRLRRQLESLDDAILTCLIGTNLFNVLFSALVTTQLAARFGRETNGMAVLTASVLVILLGEIIPKTLYREFPERFTLASAPALSAAMFITAPVRALLRGWGALWRRLLPRDDRGEPHGLDRTSLTALLLTNSLPETEDRRFRESLDRFMELAGANLKRIMRPVSELVTVTPHTSVRSAREIAARYGFSRLPVVPPGSHTPIGYVLVRDLLFFAGDPESAFPETMVRSFLLVDEDLSPYELFEELHAQGRQIALIVDRPGEALGMVTLEDLLEVVVGSIQDEFDDRYDAFATVARDHAGSGRLRRVATRERPS